MEPGDHGGTVRTEREARRELIARGRRVDPELRAERVPAGIEPSRIDPLARAVELTIDPDRRHRPVRRDPDRRLFDSQRQIRISHELSGSRSQAEQGATFESFQGWSNATTIE